VYSALVGHFDAQERYRKRKIALSANDDAAKVLLAFVRAVRSGVYSKEVARFSQFASSAKNDLSNTVSIRWPLCFVSAILDDEAFKCLHAINSFEETVVVPLHTFAQSSESGLDWEIIVKAGILISALEASLLPTAGGPFGIAEGLPAGECIRVLYRTLPEEIQTLEAALEEVEKVLRAFASICILLTVTFVFSRSPVIDGIVCLRSSTLTRRFGYQVKLSRAYPERDAPPSLDKCILVRGKPPSGGNEVRGWTFLGKADIDELVGCSLQPLVPSEWPPVVDEAQP